MEMEIDFEKMGGLVPAIIQDAVTKNVLMLGFMNKEAYEKTIATKKVTFWSRSRNCLWTKGETSGNYLNLVSIQNDCDKDTLLVKVHPQGPTCHKGTDTCWGEDNTLNPILFLSELQDFINKRHEEMPEGSQPVPERSEQNGTEGRRRSSGNHHRGHKRQRRETRLRILRPALPPHRSAYQQKAAHRGRGKRAADAPRPRMGQEAPYSKEQG